MGREAIRSVHAWGFGRVLDGLYSISLIGLDCESVAAHRERSVAEGLVVS